MSSKTYVEDRLLDHIRLVCSSRHCTITKPDINGKGHLVHKTICVENYKFKNHVQQWFMNPEFAECEVMNEKGKCKNCGCQWKMHLATKYETVEKKKSTDQELDEDEKREQEEADNRILLEARADLSEETSNEGSNKSTKVDDHIKPKKLSTKRSKKEKDLPVIHEKVDVKPPELIEIPIEVDEKSDSNVKPSKKSTNVEENEIVKKSSRPKTTGIELKDLPIELKQDKRSTRPKTMSVEAKDLSTEVKEKEAVKKSTKPTNVEEKEVPKKSSRPKTTGIEAKDLSVKPIEIKEKEVPKKLSRPKTTEIEAKDLNIKPTTEFEAKIEKPKQRSIRFKTVPTNQLPQISTPPTKSESSPEKVEIPLEYNNSASINSSSLGRRSIKFKMPEETSCQPSSNYHPPSSIQKVTVLPEEVEEKPIYHPPSSIQKVTVPTESPPKTVIIDLKPTTPIKNYKNSTFNFKPPPEMFEKPQEICKKPTILSDDKQTTSKSNTYSITEPSSNKIDTPIISKLKEEKPKVLSDDKPTTLKSNTYTITKQSSSKIDTPQIVNQPTTSKLTNSTYTDTPSTSKQAPSNNDFADEFDEISEMLRSCAEDYVPAPKLLRFSDVIHFVDEKGNENGSLRPESQSAVDNNDETSTVYANVDRNAVINEEIEKEMKEGKRLSIRKIGRALNNPFAQKAENVVEKQNGKLTNLTNGIDKHNGKPKSVNKGEKKAKFTQRFFGRSSNPSKIEEVKKIETVTIAPQDQPKKKKRVTTVKFGQHDEPTIASSTMTRNSIVAKQQRKTQTTSKLNGSAKVNRLNGHPSTSNAHLSNGYSKNPDISYAYLGNLTPQHTMTNGPIANGVTHHPSNKTRHIDDEKIKNKQGNNEPDDQEDDPDFEKELGCEEDADELASLIESHMDTRSEKCRRWLVDNSAVALPARDDKFLTRLKKLVTGTGDRLKNQCQQLSNRIRAS